MLYGAAEFSRDTGLAVLSSPNNLDRLSEALDDLQATVIAVPPFDATYLDKGHAIHFRCGRADAKGMRVDVMSKLRGVEPFPTLWDRRTIIETAEGATLDVLSLPDLVASKKTQRDKDWPMLRRLLEAHYTQFRAEPTDIRVSFWLRELRTPSFMISCAADFPNEAGEIAKARPAVREAMLGNEHRIAEEFSIEEARERDADRAYWTPLMKELEVLRRARRKEGAE